MGLSRWWKRGFGMTQVSQHGVTSKLRRGGFRPLVEILEDRTLMAAPVLTPIGNQVLASSADKVTIPVVATDPDGGQLTFAAVAGNAGYILEQTYDLHLDRSLFTNALGANEKWLRSSGGQWYFITPNGQFSQW